MKGYNNMQKIKRKIMGLVLAGSIGAMAITPTVAMAMDSRISSSDSNIYYSIVTAQEAKTHKGWKKGFWKVGAKGHVTSSVKHYANVVLYDVGYIELKRSGRKWGKGKISVDTKYAENHSPLIVDDHSKIYYGF